MAFEDYEIATRPMTGEEVFVLIAGPLLHELAPWEVTPDLPARELLFAFDFPACRSAARSLNGWFRIDVPIGRWREVFDRKSSHTLRDVCDLIAAHATTPVLEPVSVFGDRSAAAGAFLVVRRMLADAGVDVADLRPSSSLAPYLGPNLNALAPQLVRLAPGRLPWPTAKRPLHCAAGVGLLLSILLFVFNGILGLPEKLAIACGFSTILFTLAAVACAAFVKPLDVRIGDARTFRDLCRIIVGERSPLTGFPVVVR